jgi:hypothetical protein
MLALQRAIFSYQTLFRIAQNWPFIYLTDLGKARATLQRHLHTLLHEPMDSSDLASVMKIVLAPKAVRLHWPVLLLEVS